MCKTDCNCYSKKNKNNRCKRCRKVPIKRWFLPIVVGIGSVGLDEVHTYFYIPIISAGVFFIIFWNFPSVVYSTVSKPLYYEDLFIDDKKLPNYNVDIKIKKKFKNILIWVLIISNTLLVGALSDFWWYRIDHFHSTSETEKLFNSSGLNSIVSKEFKNFVFQQSYVEIIGITGGIIKIFQLFNNTIAGLLLTILRYYVKKENNILKTKQIKRIERVIRLKRIVSDTALKSLELTKIMKNKKITIETQTDVDSEIPEF